MSVSTNKDITPYMPGKLALSPYHLKRFWKGVKIGAPDECWLWQRSLTVRGGYGRFKINGKTIRAHRVSFELHHRILLPGECALHNCPAGDNPACCNPTHLWAGANADNSADMVAKDRQARLKGEGNGGAKLTEADVIAIRSLHIKGETQRSLSRKFKVANQLVSMIVNYKIWKHVP